MKVLIIEDELPATSKLEGLLRELQPTTEIVGRLKSVLDSINWLHMNSPVDILFMDVQLEDGICFEIFDAVKITKPIIFTTAYDSYALRAFEVNSLDYLVKPVTREALGRALEKYQSVYNTAQIGNATSLSLYKDLKAGYKTRFFVRSREHFKSIPIESIDCFYILEHAVFLKTSEGRKYDLDYSLDQLQHLVDPNNFFRINRNYIVNINSIQDIYTYAPGRLGVNMNGVDHLKLIVSRDKVPEFKRWLDR